MKKPVFCALFWGRGFWGRLHCISWVWGNDEKVVFCALFFVGGELNHMASWPKKLAKVGICENCPQ